MQGTVTQLRPQGVIAEIDGEPEIGDLFEIYRIQDGVEVILARGYLRKPRAKAYKINPIDNEDGSRGAPFEGIEEGDLVRSVTS